MVGRARTRQRTAIAVALSLAVHAAILVALTVDLDDRSPRPAAPPAIEVALMDLPRRPPPEPREPAGSSFQPLADQPAPRRVATIPAAASVTGSGSATPGGPMTGGAAAGAGPSGMRFGCVGLRIEDKDERVDCMLDRWATVQGRPPRELGPAIPADKLAEYVAVAQRQSAQRRPIAAMGNGSSMGCAHSNLGTGCVDDMVIPLTGSEARR